MSEVNSQFVNSDLLAKELGLETGGNDKITEICQKANRRVDIKITPYAERLPLEPGDNLWTQAQECALDMARMLWFEHNFQEDRFQAARSLYNESTKTLEQAFKAERNPRTKAVLIGSDVRNKRLLLPSQKDTYILDDY